MWIILTFSFLYLYSIFSREKPGFHILIYLLIFSVIFYVTNLSTTGAAISLAKHCKLPLLLPCWEIAPSSSPSWCHLRGCLYWCFWGYVEEKGYVTCTFYFRIMGQCCRRSSRGHDLWLTQEPDPGSRRLLPPLSLENAFCPLFS